MAAILFLFTAIHSLHVHCLSCKNKRSMNGVPMLASINVRNIC